MDDYRDLVTAAFGLACAGVMLVAGQLYLEHRAKLGDEQIPMSIRRAPAACHIE